MTPVGCVRWRRDVDVPRLSPEYVADPEGGHGTEVQPWCRCVGDVDATYWRCKWVRGPRHRAIALCSPIRGPRYFVFDFQKS